MRSEERVLAEVRSGLHSELRFGPCDHVRTVFHAGTLMVEGEVASVAVKRLVLERAAAHPAVEGIVDRLRVTPARHTGDAEIRDRVRDALLEEPSLTEIALREVVKGKTVTVRKPPERCRGEIWVRVDRGVVTLTGTAPSLAHKRLAGVLAWWVPGTRDVVNGIEVSPPEQDCDDEITDSVRAALEKDPFVDASQIRVSTRDSVVTLEGIVPKDAEREMAEMDAWFVFAVDGVDNRIVVRPGEATGAV